MQKNLKNKKWVALLVWIFVTSAIVIMAVFLLERINDVAKNVKWIENSSISFYNALSWVEEWLYTLSKNDPWIEWTWWTTWDNCVAPNCISWTYFKSISRTNTIPMAWEWTSLYDKNWNTIWIADPLELVIPNNVADWNNFKLYLRVPDFDWDWSSDTFSWSTSSSWALMWVLYWSWLTVYSSGSMIRNNELNNSISSPITFTSRTWVDLNWNNNTFANFYSANSANCWTNNCRIKLFLLNKLFSTNGQEIPYLEYQIVSTYPIPSQYTYIKADGYSYWYKKSIILRKQQSTTSEYFNFTVFN